MAENKKSFILYADLINVLEKLPDDVAGRLFKHTLRFVNDLNPLSEELLLQVAFEPMKNHLKRDLEKWSETRTSRAETGRIGGLKSGEVRRKQKEANASRLNQKEVNEAVIANENVIVSANANENIKKKDIEFRKNSFADTLKPFLEKYGKDMMNEFYKYWTQPNKSGSKFKQELEATWELSFRLEQWAKRDKTFNKAPAIVDDPKKTHLSFRKDYPETPKKSSLSFK